MIQGSIGRRALSREIINQPALVSFKGILGVHPCVVRDISALGACLYTPYYMFAGDFDLSFSGFHRTLSCRVVWRRATTSGVEFIVRNHAPKSASAPVELADILQFNHSNPPALMPSPRRTTATPFEGAPRLTMPIWRFQF